MNFLLTEEDCKLNLDNFDNFECNISSIEKIFRKFALFFEIIYVR